MTRHTGKAHSSSLTHRAPTGSHPSTDSEAETQRPVLPSLRPGCRPAGSAEEGMPKRKTHSDTQLALVCHFVVSQPWPYDAVHIGQQQPGSSATSRSLLRVQQGEAAPAATHRMGHVHVSRVVTQLNRHRSHWLCRRLSQRGRAWAPGESAPGAPSPALRPAGRHLPALQTLPRSNSKCFLDGVVGAPCPAHGVTSPPGRILEGSKGRACATEHRGGVSAQQPWSSVSRSQASGEGAAPTAPQHPQPSPSPLRCQ